MISDKYRAQADFKDMPSVIWKLENLKRLKESNPKKHTELVKFLYEKLILKAETK